jgi:predicted dienelactone hydrolase
MEVAGHPSLSGWSMKHHCFLLCLALANLARGSGLPPSGPLKLGHSVRSTLSRPDRRLSVDIWFPTDRARAPFPLLMFSPGFGNKPSQYLSQLEDLASHGFVIAAVDHPADRLDSFELRAKLWAEDIIAAKQTVLDSELAKIIDRRKLGAFGHSLGGRAAAAACLLEPAIVACMNQDGGNDDVQLLRPYWPIEGRSFAGTFAMLDWFDPGLDDEDFRAMGKTREQYAASRLEPSASALAAYRAVRRGAYRITILAPGMRHTVFTDGPWSAASTNEQRQRYADRLNQVRSITRGFFDAALKDDRPSCDLSFAATHIICFTPQSR